jgi:hypothetical protein
VVRNSPGHGQEEAVITAKIKLDVPRETVVVVADSERAVDNIVDALREEGVYQDHALISERALSDNRQVRADRGSWISGPCMEVDEAE